MADETNVGLTKSKRSGPRPISAIEFHDEVEEVITRKRCATESDLEEVKRVTERLKLDPNFSAVPFEWTKRTQQEPSQDGDEPGQNNSERRHADDPQFTSVDEAINWIKEQLLDLRALDQNLARQLIDLRRDIHRAKLQMRCSKNRALLDDVTDEMEERDALSDLCDFPTHVMSSPLKDFGITKMNISSRRFSLS